MNYDQHYMIDSSLIKRMAIYAELKESDRVLEIGGGKGALTKELALKCKVIVVEIDEKFEKELKKITKEVIIGDIIKNIYDIDFNKIVANIPYSISEQLFKIIIIKRPELCVLTVGQNFYNLLNNPDSKIHHLVDAVYEIEHKENVEPFAFEPKPRTKSVILVLKLREKRTKKQQLLFELIKQHDKKIKNAIIEILIAKDHTKRQSKEILSQYQNSFNSFLNKGLMTISNSDFLRLLEILKNIFGLCDL